jgi:hypothetical protein
MQGLPTVLGKLNELNPFSKLANDWRFSYPEGSNPPNTRSSNTWESQVNKKNPKNTRDLCNVRKFCRRNGLLQQKIIDADDERLAGFGY